LVRQQHNATARDYLLGGARSTILVHRVEEGVDLFRSESLLRLRASLCCCELRQASRFDSGNREFIEERNRDPKPFIWTARAEDILEKIERCRRRLEEMEPGCTVRRGRKEVA
jgi:hypothetical protein